MPISPVVGISVQSQRVENGPVNANREGMAISSPPFWKDLTECAPLPADLFSWANVFAN